MKRLLAVIISIALSSGLFSYAIAGDSPIETETKTFDHPSVKGVPIGGHDPWLDFSLHSQGIESSLSLEIDLNIADAICQLKKYTGAVNQELDPVAPGTLVSDTHGKTHSAKTERGPAFFSIKDEDFPTTVFTSVTCERPRHSAERNTAVSTHQHSSQDGGDTVPESSLKARVRPGAVSPME